MSDLTDEAVKALLDGATPGPWRADGEPWNRIVWSSADNRVCFMAHSSGLNDARDIATSNLVAAAPDLARALLDARAELARLRADAQAAVALVVERAATQADPWDGPVTKNKIVDAQALAAQQIKARIRALAPADGLAAVDALRAEIADLKMNMDADLRTMVREGQQLRTLAAELAAAQQREAELRGALEMSRQGWRNALELDLLPKQHRHSAKTMADIADAALASVDGLAMVQELRAEMDTLAAENASLKAAKAVAG